MLAQQCRVGGWLRRRDGVVLIDYVVAAVAAVSDALRANVLQLRRVNVLMNDLHCDLF